MRGNFILDFIIILNDRNYYRLDKSIYVGSIENAITQAYFTLLTFIF